MYEIATAYPELATYFGMLTGILYTLNFAFTGLFFGMLAETSNRKIALGLIILAAGVSMTITGFSPFFWGLAAMRILHGAIYLKHLI